MKTELRRLTRELRARAELLDETAWTATPQTAAFRRRAEAGRLPTASGGGISSLEGSVTLPPTLGALAAEVEACRKCPLGEQRIHPAFGVGSGNADVMFVGEGPGFEEDRQGEPFVGKAGQLLDRILAAIGLSRKTVYIANIVKCHPMIDPLTPERRGNDRPPTPPEMAACRGYLDTQIDLIRPRFIVAIGGVAAKTLIGTETGIRRLRGKWHEYRGVPLLPTYHPAALLRNPDWKRDVWNDMKDLKRVLESEP